MANIVTPKFSVRVGSKSQSNGLRTIETGGAALSFHEDSLLGRSLASLETTALQQLNASLSAAQGDPNTVEAQVTAAIESVGGKIPAPEKRPMWKRLMDRVRQRLNEKPAQANETKEKDPAPAKSREGVNAGVTPSQDLTGSSSMDNQPPPIPNQKEKTEASLGSEPSGSDGPGRATIAGHHSGVTKNAFDGISPVAPNQVDVAAVGLNATATTALRSEDPSVAVKAELVDFEVSDGEVICRFSTGHILAFPHKSPVGAQCLRTLKEMDAAGLECSKQIEQLSIANGYPLTRYPKSPDLPPRAIDTSMTEVRSFHSSRLHKQQSQTRQVDTTLDLGSVDASVQQDGPETVDPAWLNGSEPGEPVLEAAKGPTSSLGVDQGKFTPAKGSVDEIEEANKLAQLSSDEGIEIPFEDSNLPESGKTPAPEATQSDIASNEPVQKAGTQEGREIVPANGKTQDSKRSGRGMTLSQTGERKDTRPFKEGIEELSAIVKVSEKERALLAALANNGREVEIDYSVEDEAAPKKEGKIDQVKVRSPGGLDSKTVPWETMVEGYAEATARRDTPEEKALIGEIYITPYVDTPVIPLTTTPVPDVTDPALKQELIPGSTPPAAHTVDPQRLASPPEFLPMKQRVIPIKQMPNGPEMGGLSR